MTTKERVVSAKVDEAAAVVAVEVIVIEAKQVMVKGKVAMMKAVAVMAVAATGAMLMVLAAWMSVRSMAAGAVAVRR